jgi:hypothetical protein
LNEPLWQNLTGVQTGSGGTLSATDSSPAGAQRFYRVVILE